MKDNVNFNNILNECLDRMLQGESIEQCLRRHPEQSRELEPLLRTAQAARISSAIQPRSEFKARARYEFQSALREMTAKKTQRSSLFQWHWQWQSGWAIALVIVFIVVVSGGSTVAASGNSMPDNTLYPVKLATEKVQMTLTFSDISKAELNAKYADRRVEELIYLAAKDDPQNVQITAQRLNSNLTTMNSLVSDDNRQNVNTTGGMSDTQTASGSGGLGDRRNNAPPQTQESRPTMAGAVAAPSTAAPPSIAASPQTQTAFAAAPAPTSDTMAVASAAGINPAAENNFDLSEGQVSPGTGSFDVTPQPVFQWPAIRGIVSYDLQVSDNPTFTSLLADQTGLKEALWAFTGTLEYGKTYYWRFRTIDVNNQPSAWISSAFTVTARPVTVLPSSKAGSSEAAVTAPKPFNVTQNAPVPNTIPMTPQSVAVNDGPVSSLSESNIAKNNSARTGDLEKLKQTITNKAMSNKARLEEALEKASPQVRPALRQALAQAMAEYEKAIKMLDKSMNEK